MALCLSGLHVFYAFMPLSAVKGVVYCFPGIE